MYIHPTANCNSIHSFRLFLRRLFKSTTTQGVPHTARILSEFHAEAPHATASEGLVQGPYMAAGAGFEPTDERQRIYQRATMPQPINCHLILIIFLA